MVAARAVFDVTSTTKFPANTTPPNPISSHRFFAPPLPPTRFVWRYSSPRRVGRHGLFSYIDMVTSALPWPTRRRYALIGGLSPITRPHRYSVLSSNEDSKVPYILSYRPCQCAGRPAPSLGIAGSDSRICRLCRHQSSLYTAEPYAVILTVPHTSSGSVKCSNTTIGR